MKGPEGSRDSGKSNVTLPKDGQRDSIVICVGSISQHNAAVGGDSAM